MCGGSGDLYLESVESETLAEHFVERLLITRSCLEGDALVAVVDERRLLEQRPPFGGGVGHALEHVRVRVLVGADGHALGLCRQRACSRLL